MRKYLFALALLSLLIAESGTAYAVVLGEFTIPGIGTSSNSSSTGLDVSFAFQTDSIVTIPETIIFDSLVVDETDLGATFTATSATDPNFDSFAQYLTNGVDNWLLFFFSPIPGGGGVGQTGPESRVDRFGPSPFLQNGIDFAGFDIDSVNFTINDVNLGFFNEMGVTFMVFGQQRESTVIPEPSTLFLLGTGLLGFLFRRKLS
ncbi:MAG: hypothetical protein A3A81_07110 [Omnitrophica bacterium RIFCSPLOWO2_01_FULL_45_10b]|nr:MAG: hypothetical protein A3A81_07110 [Omnitrophica bacterium RIFCSPLOWO2_01_FULL_45_10b]